jgi:hypothetical protein
MLSLPMIIGALAVLAWAYQRDARPAARAS